MELQPLRRPGSSAGRSCEDCTVTCRHLEEESLIGNPSSDRGGHDSSNHDGDDASFEIHSHASSQGEAFHDVSVDGEVVNEDAVHGEIAHREVVHGEVVHREAVHTEGTYGDFTYEHLEVEETASETLLHEIRTPDDGTEPAAHSDPGSTETPTWRPTWLRVEVLTTFTGIFLAMTIAVPVLHWYSERNDGIMESGETFVYVWRFGPTAVLTLVAAFWGRVELQAMRYTPYILLNSQRQSLCEKDYMLDYMSMSFPAVIIHSMRRKHHLVYLTAIVSLLLKAQIALVSGLLSLADDPDSKVDVKVLDSFNASADILTTQHDKVFYIAQGVQNFDLKYPFGVTESIAYQTFKLEDDRGGRLRGSVDAPLKLFVDGLRSEFQCLKLKNYSATISMSLDKTDDTVFAEIDMDLEFSGCGSAIRSYTSTFFEKGRARRRFMGDGGRNAELQACSGLPQQDKQFMIITGIAERSGDAFLSAEVTSAAGVICSLSTWVSTVEVVDDGINPVVSSLPEQPRRFLGADIWELITEVVPNGGGLVFLDPFGRANTIGWDDEETDMVESVFYDSNALSNTIGTHASNLTSLVGHYFLRQQADYMIEGSRFLPLGKLKVASEVSFYITAMSATALIITAYVAYIFHKRNRRNSAWLRNPTTILGNLLLLHGRKPSCSKIDSCLGTSFWIKSKFTPAVMRYWVQALVAVWIINAMYWIIFNERYHDVLDRLTPIRDGEEDRILLLWTFTITVVMLSVSLYANARSTVHRSVCGLWLLSSRTCNSREIDQSFLDLLGIRALYRSIFLRAYSVGVSQLLAFASSLLPTLASVLLRLEVSPENQPHELRQLTELIPKTNVWSMDGILSLQTTVGVLLSLPANNNFTYPGSTYQDLVLPDFSHGDESTMISAEALVPTAKLQPACRKVNNVHFNLSDTAPPSMQDREQKLLSIYNLQEEPFSCPNGTQVRPEDMIMRQIITRPKDSGGYTYFGATSPSPLANCRLIPLEEPNYPKYLAELSEYTNQTAMQIYYVWGAYSWSQDSLESLFIWQCDYAWAEINTQASLVFVDDKWTIHSTRPSSPNLETSKAWSPSLHVYEYLYWNLYPEIPIVDVPVAGPDVANEFLLWLQPSGEIPVEALGDPQQQETVLRNLNRNIGIAAAQVANIYSRIHINETSGSTTQPELPTVTAMITYKSRYRIVQSTPVTYTIVGVLSVVLLASLWSIASTVMRRFGRVKRGRLLDMNVQGLAPDGFGSLAAMESLTHASNVPSFLPQNAKSMSSNELHGAISGLGFRTGWFDSRKGPEARRHFTVGVLEDEDFAFLGSKEDMKADEMLESQQLSTEERGSGDDVEQSRRNGGKS